MGDDQLIQELRDFVAASELIQSMPQVSGLLGRAADALENADRALDGIAGQQPETLRMIEDNGFVFATPFDKPVEELTEAERWEKLAFSIYTDLCRVDAVARSALGLEGWA